MKSKLSSKFAGFFSGLGMTLIFQAILAGIYFLILGTSSVPGIGGILIAAILLLLPPVGAVLIARWLKVDWKISILGAIIMVIITLL